MALKLTAGTTTHTLPDDLLWVDEFAWSPVQSERRWGTNGAQHLHVGERQAGRPITLQGGDDHGWMTRTQAETMYGLAANPATQMQLELRDGRTCNVVFDTTKDDAFSARPVADFSNPASTDYVIPTLYLIAVDAGPKKPEL